MGTEDTEKEREPEKPVMSRTRRPQPREIEIEATRLLLRDSSGKVRIMLDAGGEDGFASICIFSRVGRGSVQIGTQPGGNVVMSFGDKRLDDMLTLSTRGMVLRAPDGRLGVVVGPVVDGRDDVTVFRDGHPVWSSSTPAPSPRPTTTTKKGHRPKSGRRLKPGRGRATGA
jgi:hypothetical protein